MKTYYKNILNNLIPGVLLAGGMLMCQPASAGYPAGYYDSLEGKCGVELMRAVKAVAKNHKTITYGNATWDAFRVTDCKTVNGKKYWWDMYSNELVEMGSSKPDNSVMNIEHSVAKSWWGGSKNAAYQDIVHLNPSNSNANSAKSNYPICELSSTRFDNGVTKVGTPKSGQGGGCQYGYEPCDEYKGDFARVFMYMFTVYDDISWTSQHDYVYDTSDDLMFRPWAKELILRWSAADVVSEKERVRNDGIYQKQNNRNPYIDLPDLADHIWGKKANVPFSLNGSTPDPGPGPDDPVNPEQKTVYDWLSSNSSTMGDWTIENIEVPSAGSYVWNWKYLSSKDIYYLNGSAHIGDADYEAKAYAWSPEVSFANVKKATLSFRHAAKFQKTLRSLCKLVIKDAESGEIDEIAIPNWPEAGNWTFANSGDIDLSAYTGKKVKVGLLYQSNTNGADTWEVNDMKLQLELNDSGVELPDYDSFDDSDMVEVWGNNILAPEGARIFDMNGREVRCENLQRGVYIVVKPSFAKAVKVMVN